MPELRRRRLSGRGALTLVLVGAFGWSLLSVDWGRDLVHPGGLDVALDLAAGMLTPDLSWRVIGSALSAAWTTLAYAVAGMSVALLFGLPAGLAASGVLVRGRRSQRLVMVLGRGVLALSRSVHELVWALLFVTAVGLSPFAAILALAIPYAGILGRIYADLLNDVPEPPLRALRAAGAGPAQVFLFGRVPHALPDMAGYTFYRFECALRSSAIMSFVGLGGLGYQIQLALDDLKYGQVSTYLIALLLLIVLTDVWSSELRRRLVQ
jgi:phosphonate transport system permease protein